jgi:hypothetical protein
MRKTLGTCLPTRESLARGDAHADHIESEQRKVGAQLTGCQIKTLGRETRYYRRADLYAVVTRALDVRWFEVRETGDFPVKGGVL